MAHGENAEKLSKNGMDYWQRRGFIKNLNHYFPVCSKPGVNKAIKRLTHKRERKEIKTYLIQQDYDIF